MAASVRSSGVVNRRHHIDQVSNWSTSDWADHDKSSTATDVANCQKTVAKRRRMRCESQEPLRRTAEAHNTIKSDPSRQNVKSNLSNFSSLSLPFIGNGCTSYGVDEHVICSIQLGIGNSVRQVEQEAKRDLLIQDFQSFQNTMFPSAGSDTTPKHNYTDFRFSVFAPTAFRYFRETFKILSDDYIRSICSQPLRALSNPGRSGSLIYLTGDDRFLLKSVQKREAIFLARLLPGYFLNVIQNPKTLLPKFFGMYAYSSRMRKVRFIVMNNLIPSDIRIDLRFDLKGSKHKRYASEAERAKPSPTLKDLDFCDLFGSKGGLELSPDTRDALFTTMEKDCRVLESFSIMDYSLLVGIHRCSTQEDQGRPWGDAALAADFLTSIGSISYADRGYPADEPSMGTLYGGIPAFTASGERLLLFLGIIDILQSYNLRKRFEHLAKSVAINPQTISVTHPSAYASRFLEYMKKTVFTPLTDRNMRSITVDSGVWTDESNKGSVRTIFPVDHFRSFDNNVEVKVANLRRYAAQSRAARACPTHVTVKTTEVPTIIPVERDRPRQICILSTRL